MKNLIVIFIILYLSGCTSKGEDNIYLLENGYTGKVIIIYNEQMGAEIEYEGNKRLYRIPASGVLKTQFSIDQGYKLFPEFYYDNNGERLGIPVVVDLTENDENRVVVTLSTIGKLYNAYGKIGLEYSVFYVGSNEQIRKSSEEFAKLNLLDFAKK
ncbi:DUF6843 domain-containing protein [Sphingobacterium endophyticum]|uniref:DUF6843 domain-containing protein n=1 Tax=Sphingobacterium endophyticum TaxID=2546448 RepID=UPI0012E198E3|nr:hypothetical protein [Sphingobacterium endophyticum]